METPINAEKKRLFNTEMAFESLNRPKNIDFSRPTTEEHEKQKDQIAEDMSKTLIQNFSPEDRLDVFIKVRRNLERSLTKTVNEMANKLEYEVEYFEKLKKIIY
jgi:hypothetical protein